MMILIQWLGVALPVLTLIGLGVYNRSRTNARIEALRQQTRAALATVAIGILLLIKSFNPIKPDSGNSGS